MALKPRVAVRTEKLTRRFGSVAAVDNLTLEVPRGTIFGFLGPNGAGKTTTIRLLLGLLEPDSGHAQVLGFDPRIQGRQIRERSGALMEQPGIYDRLTAEDNLDFYARVFHLGTSARRVRVHDVLKRFDLWERRKDSPELWSTGMRQKLAIARALLHRPELLFLDEPTSGLDPIAAHELGDDLAHLAAAEGVTVFLTTHDLAEAERLCQQVAIIRAGRLIAMGTPNDLRARVGGSAVVIGHGFDEQVVHLLHGQPQVTSVQLAGQRLTIGLHDGASLGPLVRVLVGAGAQIEEVRRTSATLEDAFVALLEAAPG